MEAPTACRNEASALDLRPAFSAPDRDLQIPHLPFYATLMPAHPDLFGLCVRSGSRMGASTWGLDGRQAHWALSSLGQPWLGSRAQKVASEREISDANHQEVQWTSVSSFHATNPYVGRGTRTGTRPPLLALLPSALLCWILGGIFLLLATIGRLSSGDHVL